MVTKKTEIKETGKNVTKAPAKTEVKAPVKAEVKTEIINIFANIPYLLTVHHTHKLGGHNCP